MRSLPRAVVCALATPALALGLLACGDDDDTAAGGGEGDVQEYCEFSASLDEGDSFPTDEQLEELRDLAPEEIADAVDTVVTQAVEEGEAVFADESNTEFFDALDEIEAYEGENCGRDDADTEEAPTETEE